MVCLGPGSLSGRLAGCGKTGDTSVAFDACEQLGVLLGELSQPQREYLDVVGVDLDLLARLTQVGGVLAAFFLVSGFTLTGLPALLLGLGLLPGVVEQLLELGGAGGPVEAGARHLCFSAQVLHGEPAIGVLRPAGLQPEQGGLEPGLGGGAGLLCHRGLPSLPLVHWQMSWSSWLRWSSRAARCSGGSACFPAASRAWRAWSRASSRRGWCSGVRRAFGQDRQEFSMGRGRPVPAGLARVRQAAVAGWKKQSPSTPGCKMTERCCSMVRSLAGEAIVPGRSARSARILVNSASMWRAAAPPAGSPVFHLR